MKFKFLALSLCAIGIAPAYAQTSVSFYGIVDTGLNILDTGGGRQSSLASGISDGSRIGFTGTEDLGGGYKVIFTLESRFETDTGASGNGYPTSNVGTVLTPPSLLASLGNPTLAAALVAALNPTGANRVINPNNAPFDRTTMLGLITPVGAFLFGRQYTPAYEILSLSDTFETGTAAGWGNITGGTGGFLTTGVAIRANDALQYRIETPVGIGASLMYAQTEVNEASARAGTGSLNSSRRFWGANLRYKGNGFNGGLGYNAEQDQTGRESLKTFALGGSYAFGNAKVFAGYIDMRNDNSILVGSLNTQLVAFGVPAGTASAIAAAVGANARLDGKSYTVGMQYRIGSSRLSAAISHTDDQLAPNAQVTLYGLGYNYFLSKRTDLYAIAAYAANNNSAQYGLGGAGFTGGFSTALGEDTKAIQLGIRHKF